MNARTFKTVVFFGPEEFSLYESIKAGFISLSTVQIFRTKFTDELDQILKQSNLTAVIVKDLESVRILAGMNLLGLREASVRIYFWDEAARLSSAEIYDLSMKNITTVSDPSELKGKVEMYIMSKLSFEKANLGKMEGTDRSAGKNVYFSHLKVTDGNWAIVASTHEQDPEIENRLGMSWSLYCIELLKKAKFINKIETHKLLTADYTEILYPHPHLTKGRALSVVHVRRDQFNYEEVMDKAMVFLKNI
jgi:hypothetical protein